MAVLRIRLLGEPDFRVDGKTHPFDAPPRALPLLAYLLLRRDARLNREHVANQLWPDVDEEDARSNLRRHLHYIKRALPSIGEFDSWFEVTKTTVRWNPSLPYWLDVAEFESSSKSAKRREQAVQLYRGDLFTRCDDEWIAYDRERLRNLQMTNLGNMMQAAREMAALDAAITYGAQLLQLDPWREDTVRALMELRAEKGDRAGALSEFDRLCARLHAELDVEPMPETVALYESLRDAGRPGAQTAAAQPHATIVGRESEMEALERCWRNALNSRADIVLVGGEAGTGKTTLLAWLGESAARSGANVFTGSASADRGSALAEFADILRASRHLWEDAISSAAHRYLARLLPEIGQAAKARFKEDDSDEQLRLFSAIGDALERAAEPAPLLLRLEDLHWAGETTVLLVEYLARRLQRRRVLIAGTYREEEVPLLHPLRAFRRRFARSPFFTHIALNNLTEEQVLTLAQRELSAADAQRVQAALFRQSDGNPLVVREIITGFKESGTISTGETVAAHIALRIAALDGLAKTIAQAAAVLGSAIDLELVSALTGLPQREVLSAVNELCARHILRAHAESGGAYAFAHQLYGQAAYDAAPPTWRRDAHARTAILLESLYGDDVAGNAATLAFHAERGGLDREASGWYAMAARRAHEIYANNEAASFAERSLALAADDNLRYVALLLIEEIAERAANRDRQRDALDALESLGIDDAERRSEVLCRRLELADAANDRGEFDALLDRLQKTAPRKPHWKARIKWYLGVRAARASQLKIAAGELSDALRRFVSLGDKQGELRTRLLLFDVALNQGVRPEEILEQTRDTAMATSDPGIRGRLLLAETRLSLHRDTPLAYRQATETARVAAESGDARLEALATLYQGAAAAQLGDVETAREHLTRASELFARAGGIADQVRVSLWEGIAELNVRNDAKTLEISEAALRVALEWSLYELAMHLTNNIGIAFKNLGQYDAAREKFFEALALAEHKELGAYRVNPLQNLAFLEYELGRYAQAVGHFDELVATAPPMGREQGLAVFGCFGVCAALIGDMDRARALAARCIAQIEEGPEMRGFQQEQRFWICAQLMHLLGDDEHAQRFARMAYDTLREREELLSDDAARELFAREPSHAEIRAAVERDEWPAAARFATA